jgi:8-oxo-dGTP pyrophosphatase MutT (NUDIX family)
MKANVYCTNCGQQGHMTKQCTQPITSFGAIVFRVRGGWNQAKSLLSSDSAITGLETVPNSSVEFLLIQRRDSLGYIDIVRGKYKPDDYEYIRQQVRGMTSAEQQRILTLPFDTLWEDMWGPPAEGSNHYRSEKEISRVKLEALRIGSPSLQSMVAETTCHWTTPEWGFPKGRRDIGESEYACALRELKEETGLTETDVIPVKNMETMRELFFGSNRIQYCHKYYIFFVPEEKELVYDRTNPHMRQEIGDLRWCSIEDGLHLIRPDNSEKREVLLRVSNLLRKYCPLRLGNQPPNAFQRGAKPRAV